MQHSKSKIGKYALLRHKKHRMKEGLFIVQGKKAVEDTAPYFALEALIDQESDIRKISTLENLPDILAVYRIPEVKSNNAPSSDNFSLMLDGIQDPGNLGTIVRTAHWFGIKQIFCSEDTVDIYNPKAVMATMGSIGRVEVNYCDLKELIDDNPDLPVYGLLMEGADLFAQANLKPGLILMGSEGHGPSEEVRNRVTLRLTIPPFDPVDHPDSLNVATAAAITISQLLK